MATRLHLQAQAMRAACPSSLVARPTCYLKAGARPPLRSAVLWANSSSAQRKQQQQQQQKRDQSNKAAKAKVKAVATKSSLSPMPALKLGFLSLGSAALTLFLFDGPAFAAEEDAILEAASAGSMSFTSALILVCLGYWLVKAISYLFIERPLDQEDGKAGKGAQQPPKEKKGMDMSHSKAPIRSFIAGGAGSEDPQEFRNRSLARSAVFHILTAVKESQPRIHSMLLAEAAAKRRSASGAAPAPPASVSNEALPPGPMPRPLLTRLGRTAATPFGPTAHDMAATDPVAQLVAQTVDRLAASKGPDALDPQSHTWHQLEQQLLEELAQQVAQGEIERLMQMASMGMLRVDGKPCASGSGEQPVVK